MATQKQTQRVAPVRLPPEVYEHLRLVSQVLGMDMSELLAELVRQPLAARAKQLAPQILKLKKLEEAKRLLTEETRKLEG